MFKWTVYLYKNLDARSVPIATPSTPAVSNVLINPSLIGSKNILITTNMVSQNSGGESLKRKHEDDDDYDALWRWMRWRHCHFCTDL